MPKLTGTKKIIEEIEVSDSQICLAAAKVLRMKYNLPHGSYLNKGKICTFPPFTCEEEHGDATEEIALVLQACNLLEHVT